MANWRAVRQEVAVMVILTWLSGSSVSADILIEAYRAQRPEDADRVLAVLRDEFDKAEVQVQPAGIVAAAGDLLPLSGVTDPSGRSSYSHELSAQIELAVNRVFHGDYNGGAAALERILADARDNPALVAADNTIPARLTKAYATLAFAELRQHHLESATAVIAEQYRSFPDEPIGRIVGPEVASLSDSVRKTLDTTRQGALRVTVSQPDVLIFVNERERARGRMALHLVPGKYRVLLVRAGVSRRRTVVVEPDRVINLELDWDAELAFTVTSTWLGFVWPPGADDRTEIAMSRIARASRKHDVFIAGIEHRGARRFLVGHAFEKRTGVLVRHKAIELSSAASGGDDSTCERALARYLLKGDPSSCLIEPPSSGDVVEPVFGAARSKDDPYLIPGLATGAGAAAMIGGLALLLDRDVPPPDQLRTNHVVSRSAIGLMVGGGVAVGLAAYLTKRSTSRSEDQRLALRKSTAPAYAAAGTALAALVAGSYLLGIDGKTTCGGVPSEVCRYNYATAKYGWGLLGAGAAAAAFAVYWRVTSPDKPSAPVLGVTASTAEKLVLLGGSF